MRHLMKIVLSLLVICTLGFTSVAGATLCDMKSIDTVNDQQIMADCHNMDQTSDHEAPFNSNCDHCFHCMQFMHTEFKPHQIMAPYTVQYAPISSNFTSYFHILESPPPKV